MRKKKIKFDSLCPMYSHYYDCTNEILKDYCPYHHQEDARKAYYEQIKYIEAGNKPDQTHIFNIVSQNALNDEEATHRKALYKKYPAHPDDDSTYFIESVLDNPKNKKKAERIAIEDQKNYTKE